MATVQGKLKALLGADFRKIYEFYFHGDTGNKMREMIICPFHQDTNPSLAVDFEKGFAYCFSCMKSWDSLEFVKDREKVGIRGALRKLAKIINLEITEPEIVECCKLLQRGGIKPTEQEQKIVDGLKLKKLAYRFINLEFTDKVVQFKGVRHFGHYLDYCYEEFDFIINSGMSARKLDEIKDKVYRYRTWLSKLLPTLEETYGKLQREGWQERTGEFLGVAD
jgi:hypothetical protein